KIERLYPRSPRVPGEELLTAGGLTLRRGEVLGLAGLVGAGRTEFLREIFGLDPLRLGAVTVGAFAGPASPTLRWSQGLGFVSEDRKQEGLALGMSVADNLTLSKLERFILPARQAAAARRWIDPLAVRCQGPGQ